MKLDSTIDRRILTSWRADPDVVQRLLPAGLRPTLVDGSAVVSVCAVQLTHVRPAHAPIPTVVTDGIAHRVGVEWEGGGCGAYIWERHTGSRLSQLAGGRLFAGVLQRAPLRITATGRRVAVMADGLVDIELAPTSTLRSSLFADIDGASRFFRSGPVGISPRRRRGYDAVRLETDTWHVEPLAVTGAWSGFFADSSRFPDGSLTLDSALWMRNISARWVETSSPC